MSKIDRPSICNIKGTPTKQGPKGKMGKGNE